MSLINDALKKASQSGGAPTAETAEPLRPAVHNDPSRWPLFVVPPLVLLVLGLGALLLMRGWQGTRQNPLPVAGREAAPAVSNETAPVAATPVASAVPNPALATVTNTVTMAAAPEVPTFPKLRLQGIFWRPSRPSAMINNKTLFVGDKVEKAQVTAVDQESVTVVWNGEERVLTLP